MGCDGGVSGSCMCIWVYLISWLVINSSAFVTFGAEVEAVGTWHMAST